MGSENLCRAKEHGHVAVVTAGMHDAGMLRRKRCTRCFCDGECVDIRAKKDRFSLSVSMQRSQDAVVIFECGDFISETGQFLCEEGRCFCFFKRQFRMLMKILAL